MQFQQIRNATIKIKYNNTTLLIDPWLQEKGAIPPFSNTKLRNPTVSLPLKVDEIIHDIDAIIITHIHPDHFDETSANLLSKDSPIFVQNKKDKSTISKWGFKNIHLLSPKGSLFNDIKIYKTNGIHSERCPNIMGNVSGFVLKHASEKTVYVAGDTIFCEDVEKAIIGYQADIIILNACDAHTTTAGRLIMNKEDVKKVYQITTDATIIASHMEAVSHARLNRHQLKDYIKQQQMNDRILIPNDGESFLF